MNAHLIFSSLLMCDKKIIIFNFCQSTLLFLIKLLMILSKFYRHTKHTLIIFIHHGHPLISTHCPVHLLHKFMFPFKMDINKSSFGHHICARVCGHSLQDDQPTSSHVSKRDCLFHQPENANRSFLKAEPGAPLSIPSGISLA